MKRISALMSICLLLVFPPGIGAQEKEPSLKDTIEWLCGKLSSAAGYVHKRNSEHQSTRTGEPIRSESRFHTSTYSYTASSNDTKTIRLEEKVVVKIGVLGRGVGQQQQDAWIYRLNLPEFDPLRVEVKEVKFPKLNTNETLEEGSKDSYWEVSLQTTHAKTSIKTRWTRDAWSINSEGKRVFDDKQGDFSVNAIRLRFNEESMARRVAKAFVHAITLAGGKETREIF
jgi:hypothetical protein